ncbi:MAG: AAA family ATPase [bacterium]|nr:AAA family ATPase [bacterium]MDE0600618.1 AAA family ATPase [bacterium]
MNGRADISGDSFRQDRYGFLRWRILPQPGWEQWWDRIVVADGIKQRLEDYSRQAIRLRARFTQVGMPLHGLILLHGPPGTGKTSLAKGLANRLGQSTGEIIFAEVDAHAMPSQMLGESQRNVANLLEKSIPELAAKGPPVVVLIDEVTSVAVNRQMAMGGTDPVDVVRATDAALHGLDRLAADHPNVLLVATSNLEGAIDEAVMSRTDLVVEVPLPDRESRAEILADSLAELGSVFNSRSAQVRVHQADLPDLAAELEGLSGRRLRKLVFEALLLVANQGEPALTVDHLRLAAARSGSLPRT